MSQQPPHDPTPRSAPDRAPQAPSPQHGAASDAPTPPGGADRERAASRQPAPVATATGQGAASSTPTASSPQCFVWPGDAAAQAPALAAAVAALRRGDLVVLPTDTVYGLAAHPDLPDAIARVYTVKERPAEKALPLLVESAAQAATICVVSPLAERLMARFWPGGLTLVLPTAREPGTLALRMPDHPVPLALIRALGAPLATTSANRSGQPSCTTAAAVQAQLPTGYAVLIDAGPSPGGRDSTVLDLASSPPRVLRPGAIATADLAALVGPLAE
ncbi:MAG TPA: L-threonylcarbamoyladenylate synthase [Chloroflexota bacterium]|nr:L-threonylcarbamoyladenylate synthase [Chloroflexota bacterium]